MRFCSLEEDSSAVMVEADEPTPFEKGVMVFVLLTLFKLPVALVFFITSEVWETPVVFIFVCC